MIKVINLTKLRNTLKNRNIVFLVLSLLALPLAFISNILSAKYLGASQFGDFRFILAVFSMACTISSVGLFQASARAVVLENSQSKKRKLYSASVFLFIFVYALVYFLLLLYLHVDGNVKEKNLQSYMYLFLVFSWVLLARNYFETVLPADNKVSELSLVKIGQPCIFLVLIFLVTVLDSYSFGRLETYFVLFFLSFVIPYFFIFKSLRPRFRDKWINISKILYQNKQFGFNVYIGGVFPVALASFSEIFISYMSDDNIAVGHYALALSISSVIAVVPRCMGAIRYKRFSELGTINKGDVYFIVLFNIGLGLTLMSLISPFVSYFFGEDFFPVINLVYVLTIGMFFHGLGDFLNKFLAASGYGKKIRNSSFVTALVLFSLNVLLIPGFGSVGAALATSFVGLVYFMLMLYCACSVKLSHPTKFEATSSND